MSRPIGPGMLASLRAESATIATLWHIQRLDGEHYGFTDHDQDIVYGGMTYKASTGTIASAQSQTRDTEPGNMECFTILDDTTITREDVLAGLFDGARVDVLLIDYVSPANVLTMAVNWIIGKITLTDLGFKAEVLSPLHKLETQIVPIFSKTCRAVFGDAQCSADTATFHKVGTVAAVTDRRVFRATMSPLGSAVFELGKLTWTTGTNAGTFQDVKDFNYATKVFTLFLPMANDIQVGDAFDVLWGCDKVIETCRDRFNNVLNFRGEPWIPGTSRIPMARSHSSFERNLWSR